VTRREVEQLPVSLDTEQAAALYGVSRDHLWKLAREGRAPVEPLRLGRALRWPRALVLASLGLDGEEPRRE
jgi:predicted DNA-binding transcriptional regulator AlpA